MCPRRFSLAWVLVLAAFSAEGLPASSAGTWQRVELPYPAVSWIAPAQDGSDAVYATASDPGTGRSGAFRSEDAGSTWSLLVDALPGDTAFSIASDPRDSSHVLAATVRDAGDGRQATRLYASWDAGASWRFVNDFSPACGAEILFDPARPERVYAALGCGGGVLASLNGGESFVRHPGSVRLLRLGPTGELYGVEGGAVIRSSDGGEHWRQLHSFPCPYQVDGINDLVVDPAGRLIASTGCRRMIFIDNPGVFESIDFGYSWRLLSPVALTNIVVDPSEPSRMYATLYFYGNSSLASLDGGRTWKDLRVPVNATPAATSPSGRRLYAVSGQALWVLSIPKTLAVAPR